ncbi:MAG: Cna B-type domain-containing protein, partial [Tissierellia bacterium]|nr:Cna B-type domain-containing protein [Tissierellia bacterium]
MRISGKIPALLMVVMLVLGTAGFPVTINAAPEVKPAVETSAVQAASTENETVDAEAAKPDGDNNAEEVNPGTVSERVPTTTDDARQGEMLKKPASAVITETSPLTIAGHPSETPDTESVLSEVGIRSMVPAEDVAEAETASVPKQLRNIPVTRSTTSIWLNGQTGDDANDGLKTETAVRTFARAKALATENPDITTIYINGTVDIAGDISLAGTTAHLERAPGYDGYLLRILKDTEVRLTDIRVDGGGKAAVPIEKNSLIYVQQGTLNIGTGAVLENNVRGDTTKNILRGGAIYAYRSHIVMTDGAIQGNRATYGGGVYLSKSVFDMTGGTIRDNLAKRVSDTGIYAAGGGVTINDGSTMNLSGTALVEHNQSDEVGGGISVGTNQWSDGKDCLNMTGGTINANEAGSAGGGIFVQVGFGARFSTATVTGGNITNNRMNGSGWTEKAFGGGGIYVNGIQEDWYGYTWSKGVLYIQNAIITDNEAAYEGGGFASCPVSETKIKINNGVAFYGNRSGRGAREIYILASDEYGSHSGLPPYEITDTMLGGVKYEWQDESGEIFPKEKLKGRLENYGDYIGLQTNALPNEKTIRLAKVLISGNTSVTRGAAIGSNGRVVIGTEGEKTEVPVQKVWSDQENKYGYRPETITVRLLADGEPVETLVLKAENNWQGAFVYLDVEREGQPIVYTVEEVSVP